MDAARFVKQLRTRHRLSQAQLAYRAGTNQQAVSRIEQRRVSPTLETLERLAAVCGEQVVLEARPRAVPFEDAQLDAQAARPMGERLELALAWDRFGTAIVGKALEAFDDG